MSTTHRIPRTSLIRPLTGLLAILGFVPVPSAAAGGCPVPSSEHETIQSAIDDLGCASISLAGQAFAESIQIPRTLTITGTGSATTTIDGRVLATGTGAQIILEALGIRNGCPDVGLRSGSGARVEATGVRVQSAALACPPFAFELFLDGFETGDASRWSASRLSSKRDRQKRRYRP